MKITELSANRFVVSAGDIWMPGTYKTSDAANLARDIAKSDGGWDFLAKLAFDICNCDERAITTDDLSLYDD